MINEKIFLGYPINFFDKCYIYPPKVKDVIGTDQFAVYKKLLTMSQEDIEDLYYDEEEKPESYPTPMEYIFNLAYSSKEAENLLKKAFFFFIQEDVTFLYQQKMIIIGSVSKAQSLDDLRYIREIEFFKFQNLIRESIGEKQVEPPNPNEHPKIKEWKALARYRDRIKAKEGKGLQISAILASICCMGFGITPLNIGEISYASVTTILEYYQLKEKYKTDIDSLLAGADSKKVKPEYWIKNLD